MRHFFKILPALTFLAGMMATAQVPEISFDTVTNLLKYPDNIAIGEVAGVGDAARRRRRRSLSNIARRRTGVAPCQCRTFGGHCTTS